jgi:SAM-dependent methyltransferase
MTNTVQAQLRSHRGEYGFDAGPFVLVIGGGGVALLLVALALLRAGHGVGGVTVLVASASLLLWVVFFLHTTRRGKFAVWAELLEGLQLDGDERVLDVGCGRGAVLTMVAKRLPRGRLTGIDLWTADQSGNAPEAARLNFKTEGVEDRCELVTGDMRAMPFPDAAFDLVVSSIAIHNISDRAGRSRAIHEIARVLKPGGRLLIADLAGTEAYARQLQDLGLLDVRRRSLGWRFWWAPGFLATRLVTAFKPRDG